jgi:ribosomal protein S18 acetylase RimI-like enzyme
MEIRKATADDVEGIRTVARRSWETDYPTIVSRESAGDVVEEWYSPERLRFDVESDDALLLVAEGDGEVRGFAHAVVDESEGVASLLRLYVDPDRRGRGLGTRLLDAVRDRVDERGCSRLEAMVLERNEPGNAFYRNYGFERDRVGATTIEGETHDEVVYALTW